MKISIKRFEIERVSVTSSMPFEAVVAALKDALGQLDLVEFAKVSKQAGTFTELKEVIDRNPGKTGLMLFLELDHGTVLPKDSAACDRESACHERNGEACARSGVVRSSYRSDR
jgi:hypothetical protein